MMKGGQSLGFVIGIENCIGSDKRGTKCRIVIGIEKSTQKMKGGQSVGFVIRRENCIGPDKRGTKCRVVIGIERRAWAGKRVKKCRVVYLE